MEEMIRAGACEIYLFQSRGIGDIPEVIRATDSPATAKSEGLEPSIVGLFDEVSLEMNESGRSVTIDGTDYTSLFIAKQWVPKNKSGAKASGDSGKIPGGKDIAVTMKRLMSEVASAKSMRLTVIRDETKKLPIVGASEGKTSSRGLPVKDKDNYWDVMYDLAVRHGFILFVRGLELVMADLETFIKQKQKTIRRMLWGRNLTMLRMNRRIGKEQVPIIECVSYDDRRRKNVRGRFPSDKKQIKRTRVTGLGVKEEEVKVVRVPGVRSKSQLENIAKQYYYSLSRSEQKVEIATMDLTDSEGADMIDIRTGDAITIGFDAFNRDSTILEGQSLFQRITTLRSLGYGVIVASIIAATFDKVNIFRKPFRVSEATLEWSHNGGLSIQAELQNLVDFSGQEP